VPEHGNIQSDLIFYLVMVSVLGVLAAAEQQLVLSLPTEKGPGPAQASEDPAGRDEAQPKGLAHR
jgi:hypothetical protein